MVIGLFPFAPYASALTNSGITYHGRIVNPDGTPLQGAAVQFQMQIRSPGNENCLLYQEQQTINMLGSNGVFSITINDGTGLRTDGGTYSFDNILSNRSTFTLAAGACASGVTYNPNSSDGRVFQVSFRDENMSAYEALPLQPINFAPTAIQAKYVGGFGPANLLRFDDTAALSNNTVLNTSQLNNLMSLINGTSTQYLQESTTAGAVLPVVSGQPTTPSTGSVWYNSATNSLQFYNGTTAQTLGTSTGGTGTVTSIVAGTGLSGGTITTSGTISMPAVGTAGTYTKVTTDAQGRVSAGATLAESDIPTLVTAGKVSGSAINTGTIGGNAIINTTGAITSGSMSTNGLSAKSVSLFDSSNTNSITLSAPGTFASSYPFTFPLTKGGANQILQTDGSGQASWVTPSAGTMTSVTAGTGLTGGTITSTGTIALATTGVTASTYKSVTVDAYGRVTAGTNPTTLGGFGIIDGVQNAGGTPSVQTGLDASKPAAGTAGRVYVATDTQKIYSDSGSAWTIVGSNSGAGGTVTSVGLSAPTIFTVSGSPVTTSGTLGLTLASETAHQALLAPAGANGAPTFRNFNISDLMSSVSGGFLTGVSCTSGQALTYSSITDTMSCGTLALTSSQITTALGFTPIQNGGGTPSVTTGADASKPAAGTAGRIYVATDTQKIYSDSGSAWNLIASTTASSYSGILPVANGGTGTANGSITGTGALALAAGGSNQNVVLTPSGTGSTILNGSVGIGTASPAYDLQVTDATTSPTLEIGPTTATSGNAVLYLSGKNSGTASIAKVFADYNSSLNLQPAAGQSSIFNNGAGSPVMTILNSGNVGVGTTTPNSTLTVVGSTTFSGNSYIGNGSAQYVALNTNSGSASYIDFQNGGSSVLRIPTGTSPNASNVGIGTTTPQSKLDVAGSVKVGADATACAATIQGAIHLNGTALEYCNGTAWTAIGSSSASGTVTSIVAGTGLTGGTITSTGTIALATQGTAGTYQSVTVDAYGRITAGTNPTTLSGYGITDAVKNAGGTPSVQTGLDASKPAAGTAGRVYVATDTQKIYSDSGSAWTVVGSSSGTGGTVTSVALTAPSIFSVAGSPLTTSGTLAVTLASETAHQAFLAPAGGNGTPMFRNFNISDLVSSVSGPFLTGSSCVSGQALTYSSVTDTMYCATFSITSSQVTTALGFTPVQNIGGGLSIQEGTAAARPASGNAGALYVATDTKVIFRDNGGAWDQVSNGSASLASLTDASATDEANSNIMLGSASGASMTVGTAKRNIGIGPYALDAITTQVDDVAIGANAMGSAASPYNVAIGTSALKSATSSTGQNVAVGYDALSGSGNTGSFNTALGYGTLLLNSTGSSNTSVGAAALNEVSTGSNNTAVGVSAGNGAYNATGNDNTLIGVAAGYGFSSGSDNTIIGYNAGSSVTTGSNNIVIGSGASLASGSVSNSLNIGNAIYGNLSTPAIGIGIASPKSALDVAGSVKVGADATTCSATIQGAIHLNGTVLEYCNGTAWTALASGGGGYSSSGGTISGNVTITPSSGTGLTVSSGGETISAGGLSVTGGVNANSGNITSVGSNITGAGAMTVAAGGSNQNLTLNGSGAGAVVLGPNVGIGTSTPAAKLEVDDASTVTTGSINHGLFSSNENPTANTSANYNGLSVTETGNTGYNYSGMVSGINSSLNMNSAGTTNQANGISSVAYQSYSSGKTNTLVGLSSYANNGGTGGTVIGTNNTVVASGPSTDAMYGAFNTITTPSGNVAAVYGSKSVITNPATGTITSAFGEYLVAPQNTSSGAITNYYGLYIENPTAAGTNYSIYSAGGNNYFGGSVGIGTMNPQQPLEVNGNVRVGSQTSRTTATSRGQLAQGSTYVQSVNASVTIDWNKGNIQELGTFVCDGSKIITMNNMVDGGAYTLLLTGAAAHTGLCNFAGTGLTFITSGGAVGPVTSKNVLFTFAVINGNVVYSMLDNLQ